MFSIAVKALRAMFEDKTHRLGAALSYYAIFSLVPLLVLSLSIASFILPETTSQNQVLMQVGQFFGGPVAELVASAIYSIQGSSQNLLASLFLIVILFFGATGVFKQMKDSLNTVWQVRDKKGSGIEGIVNKNAQAILIIFFTAALFVVWTLLAIVASSLKGSLFGPKLGFVFWQGINFAGSILVATIVLAIMFAVFPDRKLRIADMILPGFVTALLFTVLRFAFYGYLIIWDPRSTYGAAGTVVIFLLWIYLLSQVFLFGAEYSKFYLQARKQK